MKLPNASRILAECELKPVQGRRFQPTGFPSLGPAEYEAEVKDGCIINCLLVESTQSLANWLEAVCMDGKKPAAPLKGIPVVTLINNDGGFVSNTMLEAHRTASAYLFPGKHGGKDTTLKDLMERNLDTKGKHGIEGSRDFARFIFRYDTPTLLHGVFVPKLAGGKYRLTRILSAFTDATGIRPAESGGVKNDHLDSTGKEGDKGGSSEGYGHVLYSRREYTAMSIKLYFSIDVALMRSYDLGEAAEELLLALAVWKIRMLTRSEIRFRTACDLRISDGLAVMSPAGYEMPDLEAAEADLKKCVARCNAESLFGDAVVVKFSGK